MKSFNKKKRGRYNNPRSGIFPYETNVDVPWPRSKLNTLLTISLTRKPRTVEEYPLHVLPKWKHTVCLIYHGQQAYVCTTVISYRNVQILCDP
jgi:hypothetical protein